MEQLLRVTPVVGLPQFNGWSHVWELALDPQTKCVICLSVVGDNAGNIGRDITENIAQLPPRSAQGLYQTLEDCIQLTTDQHGQLSIAGGIFRNKRSIFATYKSSIILKRSSKVGRILQAENDIELIEGKFDTDDVFVFSTDTARQFLSQIELSFQRGFDSDGVITAIVPALHSLEDSSTSALAFVAVTEEEPQPVYVPPAMEIDFQTTSDEGDPVLTVQQEATEPNIEENVLSQNNFGSEAPLNNSTQLSGQEQNLSKFMKGSSLVFAKIVSGAKKIGGQLLNLKRSFSSETYVGAPSSKKMKKWLLGIVIAVAVIILVVWFFLNRAQQATARAMEAAAPFRAQLASVQAAAVTDPIPARETAGSLIESIKNAQSEAEAAGEKRVASELTLVLTEAQTVYQEISGRDEVSDLPVFYDLRLVTSDFISSLATSQGSTALFVDDEKKESIALNLQTKQVFKPDVSAPSVIKSVAPFQTNQVVMLANGIYTMDLTEGATPVVIKEEGDSNRDATLTASFGDFVYVFNPAKRNIYRYVKSGEEYSDPVGWLVDPLGVPFESVVSWAIDGDIWMGTEGGQIVRFASGKSVDFSIVGLPDAFSSSLHIVTREELPNIYVLEPAQNRVVVLSKEGQFLREVKSSSLGAATSLLVDESGTKAYIVSGSTVFEVEV